MGGAVVPFAESRAHSSNATLWMPSQILAYTCIRSSHYLFTFCTHDAKNLALCTRDSKPFVHVDVFLCSRTEENLSVQPWELGICPSNFD